MNYEERHMVKTLRTALLFRIGRIGAVLGIAAVIVFVVVKVWK